MTAIRTLLGLLLVAVLASGALAQRPNRPPSTIGAAGPSVTVQLPTFNIFAVSTTVVVPDRGSAYLGGVNRGSSSRNSRGLPLVPGGARGIVSNRGASGMRASAFIHDFEAMDEAILARAAEIRGDQHPEEDDPILQSHRSTGRDGVESVASIRARQAEVSLDANQQARRQAAKAYELETAGKVGAAKIYYQMALRRASGDLKRQIAARLSALSGPTVARRP